MTNEIKPSAPPSPPAGGFTARRLLSVADLSDSELSYILELTEYYAQFIKNAQPVPSRLAGHTQINLFFEDSTRTNLSFELAGKKLGADIINVPVSASSIHKGESFVDTAQTMAAMGASAMIVRAKEKGLHETLDAMLDCPVINGGDGVREHPTQALLDAATMRASLGNLDGRVIAICGDIKHSRVAGSGVTLFQRLGAKVRFIGPAHLMPDNNQFGDVPRCASLKEGFNGADIVMGLRMQFERMDGEAADDQRARAEDYFRTFGITHETLKLARPGAKVMHPGPMNRGIEIDGALADDPAHSLILQQVFYGVPTRMAVLDALVTKSL